MSISGSQGQGKSTTIAMLKDRGIKVIENKTSRTILKEWGFTLHEVNKYPPLVKKFQEEILRRHYEYNIAASESTEWYVTERSFADIFTYAMFALGSYNEYSEWINEYFEKCARMQQIFDVSCYLTGRAFTPENDGVRSVNIHFNRSVDALIKLHLDTFAKLKSPVFLVDTPDKHERCNAILRRLKEYEN